MRAYASVFGNTDSYGDVVLKGAFANTLAEWRQRKDRTIPLLYGHNMTDPNMNIGAVIEAEEDERGLKILAQFDDDPMAQKVYRLVKAGRIAELSFAFDTVKWAALDDPDRPDAYRELQELKLYECSVVPIGANSETEVLAIKAAALGMDAVAEGLKAGRTLSKANESEIRSALAGISAAKDALEKVLPPDEDDEPEAGDGVESGAAQGPSSGTGPTLGDEQLKALADYIGETFGLARPSSKSSPSPSDPLVTEVQLLQEFAPPE